MEPICGYQDVHLSLPLRPEGFELKPQIWAFKDIQSPLRRLRALRLGILLRYVLDVPNLALPTCMSISMTIPRIFYAGLTPSTSAQHQALHAVGSVFLMACSHSAFLCSAAARHLLLNLTASVKLKRGYCRELVRCCADAAV